MGICLQFHEMQCFFAFVLCFWRLRWSGKRMLWMTAFEMKFQSWLFNLPVQCAYFNPSRFQCVKYSDVLLWKCKSIFMCWKFQLEKHFEQKWKINLHLFQVSLMKTVEFYCRSNTGHNETERNTTTISDHTDWWHWHHTQKKHWNDERFSHENK